MYIFVTNRFVQRTTSQQCLDPPKTQNSTMAKDRFVRRENVLEKYSVVNDVTKWRTFVGVPRRYVT